MAGKAKRIDVHNHVCPATLIEALRANPQRFGMRVEGEGDALRIARTTSKHVFHLVPELYDVEAKLKGLDERGLEGAYLSPGPMYFYYDLPADAGLEAAKAINEGIAAMCAKAPDRLYGMGTLPMQDPDAAVTELERVVKDHG